MVLRTLAASPIPRLSAAQSLFTNLVEATCAVLCLHTEQRSATDGMRQYKRYHLLAVELRTLSHVLPIGCKVRVDDIRIIGLLRCGQ